MRQSGSQFQRLLATLLPLLLVWVSVACLTICLGCDAKADDLCAVACLDESVEVEAAGACCETAANGAEENCDEESCDVAKAPELVVQSGADASLCPISPPPAAALQKSYSYAAQTEDETSSRLLLAALGGKSLLRLARSPNAGFAAFSTTLKPPLGQLPVLRI